jgi:ferredoxin
VSRATELHVEAPRCIRCGACRALCPGVFELIEGAARAMRPPEDAESVFAEASRWICPTEAIRGALGEKKAVAPLDGGEALFGELATSAENVRWSLGEVAWQDVDVARATPELRSVVREMAFSESATYSATQRFLETFFDDLDFSKWISVWFYEETRHPHVLIEWLRRVGEPVTADFEVKGRVSTPFMRSTLGTLVTNIISEISAAHAYRHLAATSPEPVLADIARKIAGDEARHAATFFRFARRRLAAESSDVARRDRARGLEVLQAWLGGVQTAMTHPVAQMIKRLEDSDIDNEALGLGFTAVRVRVVRVIGLLFDLPLQRPDDVGPALRELLTQRAKS